MQIYILPDLLNRGFISEVSQTLLFFTYPRQLICSLWSIVSFMFFSEE